MGRRRTEIKKIECPRARLVTFSKRRKGLFNKAAELSRFCNVDVAAVVFSPAGKIFEFGDMRLLMDRYLAGRPTSSVDSGVGHNCRSAISEIESKLSIDVSNLSLTELEEYSRVLEKMKGDLLKCFEANRQFASKGRYAEFYYDPVTCLLRSGSSGEVEAVQTSKNILYSKKAIIVAAGCWSESLMHDLFRKSDVVLDVPVKPRKVRLSDVN